MNRNQQVGAFGEELAVQFLIKRGYRILSRNLKTSYKELDIVAWIDHLVIFVEVKTRTSSKFGLAEEMMSAKKLNNLNLAARMYLSQLRINYINLRFDFVAVDLDRANKTAKIKHYKDIL